METREPIVDIVVLVHDQAGWADLAIRAVEHHTKNPYRLIVVDSASVEAKTKALFTEVERRGHTVLHLAENRSFSAGVNAGVALGRAPYIVILNDDAIVTEGWDSALLQDASAKHVGLVGARSNYASGAQMDPSFVGEPPYLVMVCVALRRQVWDAVGPLDEVTFDGFSTEDIDYAWRVKKAGYQLKVSSAFVLHAGSRTLANTVGVHINGVPNTEARARNDAKYNARLIDKHGIEWVKKYQTTVKKVLVVSYHADVMTRVQFMDDFVNLKAHGGYAFTFYRSVRVPIHFARNALYDYAYDQGFDYLMQLDDDATYPPDTIRRLLTHQKDVVCALAYQRKPPHATCAFEVGEDGIMGRPLEGIEHTGLRRVDVSGFHCSLVSTSIVKKLRDGGIKQYHGGFDSKVGEDFAVCLNLKKVGVQVYVDTDLISGHIGDAIVVDETYKRKFEGR